MNLLKSSLAVFGLIVMLAGCGNKAPQGGPVAECGSDRDCNKADACRICDGGHCTTVAGCCTTDAQCGGKRCNNVKGKAYGLCD